MEQWHNPIKRWNRSFVLIISVFIDWATSEQNKTNNANMISLLKTSIIYNKFISAIIKFNKYAHN
jgi:hypothetical protein